MSAINETLYKLSPEYFHTFESDMHKDEILKRNYHSLQFLIWFGMAISVVAAIPRAFMGNWWFFIPFAIVFVGYSILAFSRKGFLRIMGGNTTKALYIAQIPLWVTGILLGSVLDPNNPTVTFYLFSIVLPLFILDKPRRVLCYTIAWIVVFVIAAVCIKPADLFAKDMSFLVMFSFGSLITSSLLLVERLGAVNLFVESEQNARTDRATQLNNRYALERDAPAFVGGHHLVALARVDDFAFFNDMFGHEVSDDVIRIFAQCFKDHFGARRCYRYTAHELLVILHNIPSVEFEDMATQVRDDFNTRVSSKLHISPSCSFGYVCGEPTSVEDVLLMISQADVRVSEAAHAGKAQIRGGEYEPNLHQFEELAAHLGGNLDSSSLDSLTGLPNMRAFSIRSRSLIDTLVIRGKQLVIIYFDLEDFKGYNEEYGYQKGDDLLRNIAIILRESFPARLVARMGDDHFVVMCYLDEYEEGLAQTLNRTFDLHGRTNMPLRAGVYLMQNDENVGVACDRARMACQSVKNRYDVFWRQYDDELLVTEERKRHIISHLDDAISNGWLRVYYQPIVRIDTREVAECEALVRWIDPTYGFMPPLAFIVELEKARLIHKLDLWVIEQVCSDYHERDKAGLTPLPVSVNLSRLDFMLCDVESELCDLVQRYNVPTKHLHVEVTESAISEDFSQLLNVTNRLRERGFEIWLDDFGSDYSSLTTLKDFPCDVIKLDLMFLRASDDNERARLIIEQVIELSKRLGAHSLVEGVEEQRHLDFLASIGCDFAQGYLISKPEPLETLVECEIIPG